MPSRRCGALVLAGLVTSALLVHELFEVTSHQHLHSATVQIDRGGPVGWSNVQPAGVSSNGSLSEFDAAVEYSSQIFARVSKGLSLVSISILAAGDSWASETPRASLTHPPNCCAWLRAGTWKARHRSRLASTRGSSVCPLSTPRRTRRILPAVRVLAVSD